MNYTERLVTEATLKHDVLCYWQMSADIDNVSAIHSRHLPKGQNLLVFNFGNDIEYLERPKHEPIDTKFFVVPAIATSRIIIQKGKIDLFGISFIGDGFYKLINQPISKLTTHFPANLSKKYEDLYIALHGKSFSHKIALSEKFLIKNLDQNLNSPPLQLALKIINQEKGIASVSDIANSVHISQRQLQRLFKTRIGISPKDYCKIVRVNNYIDFILNKDTSVDWMDLVVEFNYNDQPHLINEVKSITKLSPKKLQNYKDTLYHRFSES